MKALILAAGRGKRLLNMTDEMPKCLVKVNGRPILEYQLKALEKNNIKDIVIVTGYKGELIKDYISKSKKFKDLNVKYIENKDYETTNSAYSFWLARDEVKNSTYIHLNSDIIFFPELIKRVADSKYENVIVIDKKVKLKEHMEQVILSNDKITKMDSMPFEGAIGKAEGVAKFSPTNTKWMIEEIGKLIEQNVLGYSCFKIIRKAVNHVDFYGIDSNDDLLVGMNTPEELKEAERLIKEYKRR